MRLPHSISSLTTGTWLHFGFLFEIICGRLNSVVCTVLKASSWFCCRSYDFSGLHVDYNLLLWNSHTCRSRLWKKTITRGSELQNVSFVLCQATYKVGSYILNILNVCVSVIGLH